MTEMSSGLSDQQLRVLLGEAFAHITRREFVPAERILAVVLTAQPEEPAALHVLGQMRRVQNRFAEAESFFHRAIAADPARPEFHFHLGQVLHSNGRIDDAIASFREAIRLKPDIAEAHFELGMAHSRKFDLAAAESAYREAARLQPGFLAAKHAWSATLISLGRPKEAETVAQSALPKAVGDMRWFAGFKHNVAIALAEQHRYDEAVHAYDEVLAFAPTLPLAEHNRANALQALGRIEDAEAGYRRALSCDPLDLMAHRGLNQLLWRKGRADLFESYSNAEKISPNTPALPVEKGRLLLLYDRSDEALEAFEHALSIAPDDERAREGHATALTRLGRFGEAIAEFESVMARKPQSVEVRCGLAECFLRANESEKALRAAEETLVLAPHNQTALAFRNTAMRQRPDTAEAALGDYDQFVRTFDLGPPEGFSDLGSFHDVIAMLLSRLHGALPDATADKAQLVSRTGGSLLGDGSEVMARFCAHLDKVVASYVMQLPESETHPFLNRRQGAMRYARSWSSRVARGGEIPNHLHEGGWISAIYFGKLPDDVSDRADAWGWTKFGEPPFEAHLTGPVSRTVRPLPGRLVLFPSYLWHGSIASRAPQQRLTIAFDVVPEAARVGSVHTA
jgi:tetratricopeptide (TPR) repeat protein